MQEIGEARESLLTPGLSMPYLKKKMQMPPPTVVEEALFYV